MKMDDNKTNSMPPIVVIGASGFVGRTLISNHRWRRIKAVARSMPSDSGAYSSNVTWIQDDMSDVFRLAGHFAPGDIVINLAYAGNGGSEMNLQLIDRIIAACRKAGVMRLIHCSTAVVAGAAVESRVTAQTTCRPTTKYEVNKLAVEQRVREGAVGVFDVGIMRPTAVVGPEGKNLSKLACALLEGSRPLNYLRASLYGRRHMHLVPVSVVVDALIVLADCAEPLAGGVHIIAADDDLQNNFSDVEAILAQALGIMPRRIPLIPMPGFGLSVALRMLGKTEDLCRYYESSDLLRKAIPAPESVGCAVRRFGQWYLGQSTGALDT